MYISKIEGRPHNAAPETAAVAVVKLASDG